MQIKIDNGLNGSSLFLSGDYGLDDVVGLKDTLLEMLNEDGENVNIDLEGLPTIDLALVQILYAARKSALKKGKHLDIQCGMNTLVHQRLKACFLLNL